MNTIFGEEHFIDTAMVELVEQRNRAIDNLVFEQMENVLKCEVSVPVPAVVIDKEKLKKWVVLCMKLENIEQSELVDVAVKKKITDAQQKVKTLEKALELAREYMFNVMCADDVPSAEWFVKCAKKEMMKSE